MADESERNSGEAGPDAEARRARRTERRRQRTERVFDTSVPSPCISVCQLDSDGEHCIGCGRNLDEIRDWPIMSAEEKRATLARLEERKARRSGANPARGS